MQGQKDRSLQKVLGPGFYLVGGERMLVCASGGRTGRGKGGIQFREHTINASCYTRRESLLVHTTC